jgi:hypothetical protein
MAILRVDIERALDELVSQENGMRFQGLAVALGKKRWPELIARQRKKDFGLDAYAPASLTPEKIGKGLALLSSTEQQTRLHTYRLWPEIDPAILGPDWQEQVAAWPEEVRADFVSDLVGGTASELP